MPEKTEAFKKHYHNYLSQIATIDLANTAQVLGLTRVGQSFYLPLFDHFYEISKDGFWDEAGKKPHYGICVILAKYLLMCPDRPYLDPAWAAFKDFKKASHFLNVNYFRSDTENMIARAFGGRSEALEQACLKVGGKPNNEITNYDLTMEFQALPKVSLLLIYNDEDMDFPVYATVLFQKHAEYYLDPESLAMTSAVLAAKLKKAAVIS